VLVADGNAVSRRILCEQITAWRMRSDSLELGTDVVATLCAANAAGDPYDFLVLDYQMPVMNAEAVTAAVRSIPAIGEMPIIVSTSIFEKRGSCSSEVDAYLTKPVRLSHLSSALTKTRLKRQNCIAPVSANPDSIQNLAANVSRFHLRVLVADDNAVNQRVAVRMLEKFGIRADVAGNGLEAVRMLRTLPYDAVFMDCQMPEMDGYAAAREIRRSEKPGQHITIIAMTAEALVGAREYCLAAGMDDYIAKPVKLEDLLRAIEKWLSRKFLDLVPQALIQG
jgi:CheY-like chemotaxis protein